MVEVILLKHWQEILFGALVIVIIVFIAKWDSARLDRQYNLGYDTRTAEYEAKIKNHQDETLKINNEVDKSYEKVVTKIIKVPVEVKGDTPDCISDNAKRVNQWMRDNYTDPYHSE
jgi:hypothetical protein